MKATDVMHFFKAMFLFVAQLIAALFYIITCYLWCIFDKLTEWTAVATEYLEKLNDFINNNRFKKKQPQGIINENQNTKIHHKKYS